MAQNSKYEYLPLNQIIINLTSEKLELSALANSPAIIHSKFQIKSYRETQAIFINWLLIE